MKQITQEEANKMIEQGKEELQKMLDEGRKITKTIIEEKDKITTELLLENPADNKPTGTRVIIEKDNITLQKI